MDEASKIISLADVGALEKSTLLKKIMEVLLICFQITLVLVLNPNAHN